MLLEEVTAADVIVAAVAWIASVELSESMTVPEVEVVDMAIGLVTAFDTGFVIAPRVIVRGNP